MSCAKDLINTIKVHKLTTKLRKLLVDHTNNCSVRNSNLQLFGVSVAAKQLLFNR